MIKVLHADDHAIVRQGLKQILADTPSISVTGEAGTAKETIEHKSVAAATSAPNPISN